VEEKVMRGPDRRRLAAALLPFAAASALWMPSLARAQGFPTRTVRMLVPTPPGSSVDLGARLVAERLRERLGQPVVVENRPGAGGTIAAAEVARAAPDGHTLLVGFNGPLATAGLLYPRLTYKPLELTPVIATVTQPHVMVVAGNHPSSTLREFVDRARAAPGRFNYASVGNASGSHLAMELFKSVAGLFIVHIPYNGGPAATQAVMNGDVDALFTALVNVQGQVAAGRLKVLGLAERERTPAAPGIATFAEQGFPQVVAPLFNAVAAPPGTPADVVQRLNADIAAVLAEPTVRQRLSAGGMEVIGGTPTQMAALTRAEVERWAPVVKRLQLTLD
jgi:tripartite-type tricarboxylate transporter receptor subunit TctC